jgi:YggT family protein
MGRNLRGSRRRASRSSRQMRVDCRKSATIACERALSCLFARHHSTGRTRNMTSIFQILMLLLSVAKFIVIAHIIMSWLISFGVLNLGQPIVAQLWDGLNRLLQPIYDPIRRILPNMGGLDLAPLVVILGILALEIILSNNVALFL